MAVSIMRRRDAKLECWEVFDVEHYKALMSLAIESRLRHIRQQLEAVAKFVVTDDIPASEIWRASWLIEETDGPTGS